MCSELKFQAAGLAWLHCSQRRVPSLFRGSGDGSKLLCPDEAWSYRAWKRLTDRWKTQGWTLKYGNAPEWSHLSPEDSAGSRSAILSGWTLAGPIFIMAVLHTQNQTDFILARHLCEQEKLCEAGSRRSPHEAFTPSVKVWLLSSPLFFLTLSLCGGSI